MIARAGSNSVNMRLCRSIQAFHTFAGRNGTLPLQWIDRLIKMVRMHVSLYHTSAVSGAPTCHKTANRAQAYLQVRGRRRQSLMQFRPNLDECGCTRVSGDRQQRGRFRARLLWSNYCQVDACRYILRDTRGMRLLPSSEKVSSISNSIIKEL